jgi:FKBP-type peptidyl-prolyl cis-trans isomerase
MDKQYVITTIVIVGMVGLIIVGGLVWLGTQNDNETNSIDSSTTNTSTNQNQSIQEEKFTELQKEDVVVGEGKEAKNGDTVSVHYTGTLKDGTVFDSSVERGTPFSFTLGAGEVIQGWDQGVAGMKEGGKRTLKIPSDLAYGARGAGELIGPNEDLIFEVELLEVK